MRSVSFFFKEELCPVVFLSLHFKIFLLFLIVVMAIPNAISKRLCLILNFPTKNYLFF